MLSECLTNTVIEICECVLYKPAKLGTNTFNIIKSVKRKDVLEVSCSESGCMYTCVHVRSFQYKGL